MNFNKDAQDVSSIERPPGKRIRKTQPNTPPKNKKYTKTDLKSLEQKRYERYQMLLDSARSNDMESTLVLPQRNKFEIGMVRKSITIHKKLEFIDIYDYLVLRQKDIQNKVSFASFGGFVGYDIPKSTMHGIYRRREEYRKLAKELPEDAYYVLKRREVDLEKVIIH
jgi:hypothetical protein